MLRPHDPEDLPPEHRPEDDQAYQEFEQRPKTRPIGDRQRSVEREQQHDAHQDPNRRSRNHAALLTAIKGFERGQAHSSDSHATAPDGSPESDDDRAGVRLQAPSAPSIRTRGSPCPRNRPTPPSSTS